MINLHRQLSDHLEVIASLRPLLSWIDELGRRMSFDRTTIFVCGNGGSAADAQHFVAELVVRYRGDRPPRAALALTTDTSILTATANDLSFTQVFARQIAALGKTGDYLLALSTSGRSPNVLEAVRTARARGLFTVALTGAGGLAEAVDWQLAVPSESTARIQEAHHLILHLLCEYFEEVA